QIYGKASNIIQNFYVMAHTSAFPCNDGLPRIVQVTVNDSTTSGLRVGTATGSYALSGIPNNYDLQLSKSASRDSVQPGQEIRYTLRIDNLGPHTAYNYTLSDSISQHLIIPEATFSKLPNVIENNVFTWRFDSLAAFQTEEITYTASVPASLPDSISEVVSSSTVMGPCDTRSVNDITLSRITIFRPPRNYDLQLTKSIDKDTVHAEETFQYELRIENLGPNTASGLTLIDSLPDFITINRQSFNRAPDSEDGNLLIWQLDSLTVSQDTLFTFSANVAASLADSMMVLVNSSIVDAPGDTNATNNLASAIVVIRRVPKNYDLQLTKTVDKDTVRTEETFQYELRIENLGPNTASGLTLIDSLPDFITINRQSFNREPDSDEGNLFIWQLDSLTVSQDTLFTFSANVAASLADSVMVLVNSSIVDAPLDTNATNNLASAFVVAIEEIVRFRENCQLFTFDHNVFEPAKHQSLRINFELESDQSASLELYDVSGYRVSTLTSSHFVAGSNTFDWNGMTENGQKVGSGVYIVALRANKLICWKKVIVVQ
ncbi:DUF11 domain-containing protein, partial [candidate division KSB1 bacterium]|nr:DUF11 domain-containing protein [candidate division KSB1 bacterium]NIS28010.1 DUF11 domain-containing protein [candidate division KSB1 bacterium]NIU28661.1 DUF11 domain-containing protein [candidate division KSB1 bacterium]NIU91110.1 DUF11 domain-containing protein [candidate division KSB1 bacterium]NIW22570.1 DUF11 domain-containing protein [candidate division KSB1 bacterium]